MREFLAICLKRQGYDVAVADSGTKALSSLSDTPFDVLVTDLMMPGELDGMGLLERVKGLGYKTEVIVVTAYATADTAIEAMKKGAYDYLTKPFKVDEIDAVITRALEKRALVAENSALRDQVSGRVRLASLIGRSSQMKRVFSLIEKVHSTKTSVLITGESGTGKELVARALHTEGNRSDRPFVAVNCGAIPGQLLESELFGHVKGSFTGAVSDKVGLFSQAGDGILFLDEIGELPQELQVKLLRALQERTFKPVGSTEDKKLAARIIAATNRDLEEEVERGAFRSDLYYRLNVIEVAIAPLRQRPEDLPPLIDHFLRIFGNEQKKRIRGLTSEATRVLSAYHYPGNVRELENIIERAVTLAGGDRIDVDDLPPLKQGSPGAQAAQGVVIPDEGIDLAQVVHDYERSLIERALQQSGGIRKAAASLLGISFRSFRYRLAKLGLAGQEDDGEIVKESLDD